MNKEKCSICDKPMGNSLFTFEGRPAHSKHFEFKIEYINGEYKRIYKLKKDKEKGE